MSVDCKAVFVGDNGSGKTCYLITWARGEYPRRYVQSVFDGYARYFDVEEARVLLTLWDTAAHEDYDQLRPLSYPGTSVFVVCFSLVDPASLRHITTRWFPEIQQSTEQVPIVLLGLKQDLVEDPETIRSLEEQGLHPVTDEEANQTAQEIGAFTYLKCSSIRMQGVNEVLHTAMRHVVENGQTDLSNSISSQKRTNLGTWVKQKLEMTLPEKPEPKPQPEIELIPSNFEEQSKDLLVIYPDIDRDVLCSLKKRSWESTRFSDLYFVWKKKKNNLKVNDELEVNRQTVIQKIICCHRLILSGRSQKFFEIFEVMKNQENNSELVQLLNISKISLQSSLLNNKNSIDQNQLKEEEKDEEEIVLEIKKKNETENENEIEREIKNIKENEKKIEKGTEKKKETKLKKQNIKSNVNQHLKIFLVEWDFNLFSEMIKFCYFGELTKTIDQIEKLNLEESPQIWFKKLKKLSKIFGIEGLSQICRYHLNKMNNNKKPTKGKHVILDKQRQEEKNKTNGKENENEKEKENEQENEQENEKENEKEEKCKEKEKHQENLNEMKKKELIKINESFKGAKLHTHFKDFVFLCPKQLEQNMVSKSNYPVAINKFILGMKSQYFRLLFGGGMVEQTKFHVNIENFDVTTMKELILFLYNDELSEELPIQQVEKILIASDYFQLPRLQSTCSIRLSELSEEMDCDQLIELFLCSKQAKANQLTEFCFWKMGFFFQQLEKSQKFKKWLTNEEKIKVEEMRYPPKNYLKAKKGFKLKVAKTFGLVKKEDEKKK
ncbi:gtp-binding protein rho4 [Anaeramoeba flamelloides]|uniref:Gtp-binding protein rho4 n=1 Tax=Anaeramoeba flamelloides TaxID=1746091 RepID=A0AAV8ACB8_9EUKA|nr:gtp-binding protein rho4 [Anaeramoeba flamelloides]